MCFRHDWLWSSLKALYKKTLVPFFGTTLKNVVTHFVDNNLKRRGCKSRQVSAQDFLATERGMKAMETGRTLFWDFHHEVGTGNDYCWLRRHSHGHGRFRLWWRCGFAFAPDEAWCSPQTAYIQSSGPTGQTKLCFSDFQTRFLFFFYVFVHTFFLHGWAGTLTMAKSLWRECWSMMPSLLSTDIEVIYLNHGNGIQGCALMVQSRSFWQRASTQSICDDLIKIAPAALICMSWSKSSDIVGVLNAMHFFVEISVYL